MFDRIKQSSKGAIDLASIMVGIIVIGLIGGVIAATVFTVIPWAQDNAAKSQLDAIATAQSAYAGFAASEASGLSSLAALNFQPTAVEGNKKFASLEQLNAKGLFKVAIKEGSSTLSADGNVCASFDAVAGKFDAAVISGSGNVFTISATNMTPTKAPDGDTCVGTVVEGKLDPNPVVSKPAIMISTWDTSLPGCTTITLPMSGNINVDVDWGDGTVEKNLTSAPKHGYYAGPHGNRIVTVSGTFEKWGSAFSTNMSCVTKVISWGDTGTTDLTRGFHGARNLIEVSEIPISATNLSAFFAAATIFNGDIDSWDTRNVTNMNQMFSGALAYNKDMSSWNTAKVTDMSSMFYEARVFNGDISKWDTRSVTTMNGMFAGGIIFNGDISKWDTRSVTSMQSMFSGSKLFNGDISKWDTRNVTTMFNMFAGSKLFNSDISNWDTGNVTNWGNFALQAESLKADNIPAKFK